MICERCGTTTQIGDWPWCPHGHYRGTVIGDDIPGGQVIEHLGHEPMTFYSKKAILAEADRRGLQPFVRWVPGDRHLTNWGASIDPYTLAAAAELVARRSARSRPEPPDEIVCETAQFEVKAL